MARIVATVRAFPPVMKIRVTLCIVSCVLSIALGLVLSRGGWDGHLRRNSEAKRESATAQTQTLTMPEVPTAKARKPRIGLSLDTLKEERWQRDRDTFVAKAQALGAEVVVLSANSDDVQQIKDCNSLLGQNIDVLVIAPHNGDAMSKAVEEAHASGVMVCAYDRLIKNCDLDYYFTFDNVKVGELQGRFLMERLFPAGPVSGGEKSASPASTARLRTTTRSFSSRVRTTR